MAEESSQRIRGLIFLYHLNLQIVEIDSVYEIILGETGFAMAFEFADRLVEPDWLAQVELHADSVQSPEHLVGAGVVAAVFNADIPQHVIVLKGPCP